MSELNNSYVRKFQIQNCHPLYSMLVLKVMICTTFVLLMMTGDGASCVGLIDGTSTN